MAVKRIKNQPTAETFANIKLPQKNIPTDRELVNQNTEPQETIDDNEIEEVTKSRNDDGISENSSINQSKTEGMDSTGRNFSLYQVPQATNRSTHEKRSSGALSLVYAKTGNRLALSKEITLTLDNPEKVQIIYNDNEIIIGTNLIPGAIYYNVCYQNERGIIYSKGLVKELIDHFKIDFTNRTSRSVGSLSSDQNNGESYAVISNLRDKYGHTLLD